MTVLLLNQLSLHEVGYGVAGDEAEDAADDGGGDIACGGEDAAGAEYHGVFKGKGRQGGVAAAESCGEGKPQVGGFNEARRGQPAEEPHEQAAAEVDEQGVPGHARQLHAPAGADVVRGEVAQHAAGKAAAANAEQGFEGKYHEGRLVNCVKMSMQK